MPEPPLRLLASAREVGDLFTRLVAGLFESLGYQTWENVGTAGREIDILGKHREEPHRRLCVECKATAKPIGGEVLNKFSGVLEGELLDAGSEAKVEGYVVSLHGFTSAALKQEARFPQPRFTLWTGAEVVAALERGQLIVSRERIRDAAERCAERLTRDFRPDPPQLLGVPDLGWIWAVVYRRGGVAAYVALLLGADGTPLDEGLARRILATDEKGPLAPLTYLAPLYGAEPSAADLDRAEAEYRRYLVEHWSTLSFRGMGVQKLLALPLTELYIPLHAVVQQGGERDLEGELIARRRPAVGEPAAEDEDAADRESLLEILARGPGLVLLGHPGAGKSTFLKYVAVMIASGRGEELGLPADRLPVLLSLAEHAAAARTERLAPGDFFTRRCGELLIPELPWAAMLRRAVREGRVLWLLDGLDEVRGEAARLALVAQLETLIASQAAAGNRFALTSRIVGYDRMRLASSRLRECRLAPLGREEIAEFVDRWTALVERSLAAGEREGGRAAAQERQGLLRAIEGNPRIAELAANPLLLTILALMKRQGVELPERRVLLYQNYVDTLLAHWPRARATADQPVVPEVREVNELRRVLDPLALWMQKTAGGRGVVEEAELRRFLVRWFEESSEDPVREADAFLEEVRETASLLVERGSGEYGFLHLTFQEFLAAAALASEREEPAVEAVVRHAAEPEWHEVIQLAVGCLAVLQVRDRGAGEVLRALLREQPGEPEQAVVLAGRALADTGVKSVPAAVKAEVVEALLQAMVDDGRVVPKLRAAAGKALAAVGDPRAAAMTIDGIWENLCTVEAGPFWMGSDPEKDRLALDREKPYHQVDLPYGFRVAKYPVTVEQYRLYVLSTGEEPGELDALRDPANWPVHSVSWDEALSFCRWLTARWREEGKIGETEVVALPSEAEWEKAARGGDGLTFPWGNDEDANRMSYWLTEIREPSSVGCFPGGASLCGCEEMAGNVFEWTRSLLKPYPYVPGDGREELTNRSSRVVRGGSFGYGFDLARAAFRSVPGPTRRGWGFGFRVVVRPFSSGL